MSHHASFKAALTLALCLWSSLAAGNVIVEIYVQVDNAFAEQFPGWAEDKGLMRIDGEWQVIPSGVCGMKFLGITEWGWNSQNGFLNTLPNNGVPIPPDYNFQYTAPYAGCGASSYVFTTPATPGGETPYYAGADRLVVQVPNLYHVQFLDTSFDAVPAATWPEDPPPFDLCSVPEFCEIPFSIVQCFQDFEGKWHCDEDYLSLSLGLSAQLSGHALTFIDHALALRRVHPADPERFSKELRDARKEATKASEFLAQASRRAPGLTRIPGVADEAATARIALSQCVAALDRALAQPPADAERYVNDARLRCDSAKYYAGHASIRSRPFPGLRSKTPVR
jgi:hypothetical protein